MQVVDSETTQSRDTRQPSYVLILGWGAPATMRARFIHLSRVRILPAILHWRSTPSYRRSTNLFGQDEVLTRERRIAPVLAQGASSARVL